MTVVSVVVPTCNRPDMLARCLNALIEQDAPHGTWEIVVADDGRSDATRCQVEHLARMVCRDRLVIRYVRPCSASGPAAARNAGWRAARGEIIAFTDDDCIPQPGWLKHGTAVMACGYALVGGWVNVPSVANPTDYERNAALLGTSELVTANCFIRRSVLEALGGFDERFAVAWREDSDLLFRAFDAGMPVGSAPEAVVEHPIRPAPWGVSISQQRKSMYNALLFKKHPCRYRERIQTSPPWHYYRIVAALLLGIAGLVTRQRSVALSGVTLWALLTGRFCRMRLRGTRRTSSHITEMVVTSALIPPLAIFWRIRGAIRFRVFFL